MKRATLLAAAVLTGCTSTTVINSNPDHAQVLIDGAPRGETPFTYAEQVNAGTRHQLTLRKAGYRDLNTYIAADQWNVGKVIISALFCLPGLFFSSEYPPGYNFSLEPAQPQPYPQTYPGGYPSNQAYPPPQGYPPPQQSYPNYPPPPPAYPPPPPPNG